MQVNRGNSDSTHFGKKLEQLFEIAKKRGTVANNEAFAAQLGIHPSTLFRNFKSREVKIGYMQKACELAGVSDDFLYNRDAQSWVSEPATGYSKGSDELKLCKIELDKYKSLYELALQQIKTQNQVIEMLQKQLKE